MNTLVVPLALVAALSLAACSDGPEPVPAALAEAASLAATAVLPADPSLPTVTVYKSPTCGCCSTWVEHLEQNGFPVEIVDVDDLNAVKQQYGIPASLRHTAIVDGYVIEGHVPAADVKRLLDTRPEAAGLTVPGMPIGSPGMEIPGRAAAAYEVLLVDDGQTTVFARH